ncbi:TPA: hypothetical protein QCR36_004087 [Bacillus cereus]|nr:hypothetical protein [Bacillus cereus]HDR4742553.1 hypothetical protein [Bacillus cereus]HDR4748140.1 hypothetical protein [Bacillus cereus]HDR4753614.1 hypothetical protein [Bacillus cereus]HDR4770823.1 hypothetical protein [Bacillus cereus]
MNNLYGQFQSDVQGAANNMMTQLLCAEKGIDYNQLMQQAQMAHVNGILQAEQQRQMANLVKRHYQGNSGSIVSKIKDMFVSEPAPNMFMPMAPMPGMQPMVQNPMQPQQGMTPQQVSSFLVPPTQPAVEEIPLEDNSRIEKLEKNMEQMMQQMTQFMMAMQQPQQTVVQPAPQL